MTTPQTPTLSRQRLPMQRADLYEALCKLLSERADQVDWASFQETDWQRLARLAKAQGVAPLAYWTFSGRAGDAAAAAVPVPEGVLDELRREYYQTAAQNALLYEELGRILAALDEAGIPVIVLKGAALAATIYPDPALRPMNDLDLMVKPEDLGRAVGCLRRIGFSQEKITYHVVLRGGAKRPITVEVHWSLVPGFGHGSPDLERFWKQTELLSGTALTLIPTAQLLYLASHLFIKEGRKRVRLLWLFDLYLIVEAKGEQINWNLSERLGIDFGWEEAVQAILGILKPHYESSVPLTTIRQSSTDAVNDSRICRNTSISSTKNTSRIWTLKALASLGWKLRIQMLWGFLFPSRSYIRLRYGPKSFLIWPWFYLYRILIFIRSSLLERFKPWSFRLGMKND